MRTLEQQKEANLLKKRRYYQRHKERLRAESLSRYHKRHQESVENTINIVSNRYAEQIKAAKALGFSISVGPKEYNYRRCALCGHYSHQPCRDAITPDSLLVTHKYCGWCGKYQVSIKYQLKG